MADTIQISLVDCQQANLVFDPARICDMNANHTNELMAFAKRLNELIVKAGLGDLTQKQLGARWGVSGSFVGFMRKGQNMPAMPLAVTISKDLNVSIDYLLTGRKDAALDTLDISELPEQSKVAMRAAVHALAEQAATYKVNNGN
jgi:DNA-binding XRE family transcriptional regulator